MTIYFPESSVAFLREGYTFISRRCDRFDTDTFRTRLMLRPVVCLWRAEAAEFFYEGGRFSRAGAMPRSAKHLLQDAGSVQSLEGAAHHHRKQLFLALTDRDSVERLGHAFNTEWHAALQRWQPGKELVLHDELRRILTAAACRWAGVPADEHTVERRSRELSLMIDQAGGFGPANWYARWRRRATEKWAAECIRKLRDAGPAGQSGGSPAAAIAFHTDELGATLPPAVAAVELLNLLRPIVAVSRFMVFAEVALQ